MFADTPHLFKLARNHLLDSGLALPGGGRVDRDFFTEVLSIDAGREFKLLPKLGLQSHVEVSNVACFVGACVMAEVFHSECWNWLTHLVILS